MTFATSSGGSGFIASLLNDLNISIAFNHFTGDTLIPTLFPSVKTDTDGNYEIVVYTPSTSGASASSILKSITVESATLSYIGYGLLAIVGFFLIWKYLR